MGEKAKGARRHVNDNQRAEVFMLLSSKVFRSALH